MNIDNQISKIEDKLASLQKELNKRVKQKNSEFRRSSKAKQRVTIAKDVLAWLELGKLTPKFGEYLELPVNNDGDVGEKIETCSACALGSAFACIASRSPRDLNELQTAWGVENDVQRYHSDGLMRDTLAEYFDKGQLDLIESAFEQGEFNESGKLGDQELKTAISFKRQLKSPRARLTAIMNNIIENDGTFIP